MGLNPELAVVPDHQAGLSPTAESGYWKGEATVAKLTIFYRDFI